MKRSRSAAATSATALPTRSLSIRVRDVTKRFPSVVANDGVDFHARAGEVHALLGENGAGKSTLCNILTGLYRPDGGTIELDGTAVAFDSPRDALDAGIGMVHQEFRLVQPFTVAENVVLGHPDTPFVTSPQALTERVRAASDAVGLRVDPTARVWQLSVGEQQRVEILRVLYHGAAVLILDEPTAVLTPAESDVLFSTLRTMVADGRTVVFISHKLEEVMAVADRVTVLRDGRTVGEVATADTSTRELADMMVGRTVLFSRVDREVPAERDDVVLDLREISADNDTGGVAVDGVSLRVGRGEIVGVAGVAGNGQRELCEVIAGMRRARHGSVDVAGATIDTGDARSATRAGVAYVPEDRRHTGMAAGRSIADNLVLKSFRRPPMSRLGVMNRTAIRAHATRLVADNDVKAASIDTPARLLSGGNVQKVMLAREFTADPRVLVAASPTRGLDVGATETIRSRLAAAADAGVAILLVSEDIDELLTVADRIVVMYEGRIVGEVTATAADRHVLGLMMGGAPALTETAPPTDHGPSA